MGSAGVCHVRLAARVGVLPMLYLPSEENATAAQHYLEVNQCLFVINARRAARPT